MSDICISLSFFKMALPDIFNPVEADLIIDRINKLTPQSKALWGKMTVAQMLAHCCIDFEMVYTDRFESPNRMKAWFINGFLKHNVVNDKPYKKNSRTLAKYIVKEEKDFDTEKKRLIQYISMLVEDGRTPFEGKYSVDFGKLRSEQWNNLFYKHIDHHLKQFGC